MLATQVIKRFFGRQAAVKALTKYEAIPHYMKEKLRDPHEYKLRTMKEIKDELPDGRFTAQTEVIWKDYNDAKFHESALNRKVKINVKLQNWKLTNNQRSRLELLLGNRKMNSDSFLLTCDMYDKPELNFEKLVQQIQELYLETKRAP